MGDGMGGSVMMGMPAFGVGIPGEMEALGRSPFVSAIVNPIPGGDGFLLTDGTELAVAQSDGLDAFRELAVNSVLGPSVFLVPHR